jgi:hypothetical protein
MLFMPIRPCPQMRFGFDGPAPYGPNPTTEPSPLSPAEHRVVTRHFRSVSFDLTRNGAIPIAQNAG